MAGRGRRAQWLIFLLAAGGAAVAAPPPLAKPAPGASGETDSAAAELLLYLSEFEDADGGWIDPAELPPADAGKEDDDER